MKYLSIIFLLMLAASAGAGGVLDTAVTRELDRARQFSQENRPAEAIAVLKDVTTKYPMNGQAKYDLGLLYAEQKRYDLAAAELTAAKQAGVKDPKLNNSLGWAYLSQGKYQTAVNEFELAVKSEEFAKLPVENQRKVLNNTGLAYAYLGQHSEAKQYYDRARQTATKAPAPSKFNAAPDAPLRTPNAPAIVTPK